MPTTPTKEWFSVDRKGLAAIIERRGKEFAVLELIQNAWDTGAQSVQVELSEVGRGLALLIVRDDDPDGFKDLAHAFTLFAPSEKKGDATKRGRFNLGEKLVLALCKEAAIKSTTGTVIFRETTGREVLRGEGYRRLHGTEFNAEIRMLKGEVADAIAAIHRLIIPAGVTLSLNGEIVTGAAAAAAPEVSIDITLPTEVAGEDGVLRRTRRKTTVHVYAAAAGATGLDGGAIYELGIPVVETGDGWHYDVQQKVPMSLERDNVAPSYLLALRTAALNHLHDRVTPATANAPWIRDALDSPDIDASAVEAVLTARFGDKRVIHDMSDPEANKLAMMAGYTVIPPQSFSKASWANIRTAGAALPAGHVTPSDSGPRKSVAVIPRTEWTAQMAAAAAVASDLYGHLFAAEGLSVVFYRDAAVSTEGSYSTGPTGTPRLAVNLAHVVTHDNAVGDITVGYIALLIHEFAHRKVADHLSRAFYTECCDLGAALAMDGTRTNTIIARGVVVAAAAQR